jgi:hypothetical protein
LFAPVVQNHRFWVLAAKPVQKRWLFLYGLCAP